MADCARCGRDLYRFGNISGNTLDGYTTSSNLCKECNRIVLTERGMGELARKDARDDRIASLFWTVLGWAVLALVIFGVIGTVFAH